MAKAKIRLTIEDDCKSLPTTLVRVMAALKESGLELLVETPRVPTHPEVSDAYVKDIRQRFEESKTKEDIYSVLSHIQTKIVNYLLTAPEDKTYGLAIADAIGKSAPGIEHSLKLLVRVGVLIKHKSLPGTHGKIKPYIITDKYKKILQGK